MTKCKECGKEMEEDQYGLFCRNKSCEQYLRDQKLYPIINNEQKTLSEVIRK